MAVIISPYIVSYLAVPREQKQFAYKFIFHLFPNFLFFKIYFRTQEKNNTTKLRQKATRISSTVPPLWPVSVAWCDTRLSGEKSPWNQCNVWCGGRSSARQGLDFWSCYSDSVNVIVAKLKHMIWRHERSEFCCLIHIQGTAESLMLNWILIRAGFGPKMHFKTIQTDGST